MATREIAQGVVSYMNADGHQTFGQLGDVVDVHEKDLDRFDRLNVRPQPEVVLVVGTDVTDAETEIADELGGDPGVVPVDPTEGLDLDGLRAYAFEREIDLGRATTEDGIRTKIREAGTTPVA